jgi:hypothetical protein
VELRMGGELRYRFWIRIRKHLSTYAEGNDRKWYQSIFNRTTRMGVEHRLCDSDGYISDSVGSASEYATQNIFVVRKKLHEPNGKALVSVAIKNIEQDMLCRGEYPIISDEESSTNKCKPTGVQLFDDWTDKLPSRAS